MKSMIRSRLRWAVAVLVTIVILNGAHSVSSPAIAEETGTSAESLPEIRGAMLKPTDATTKRLDELKSAGTNTIVFALRRANAEAKKAIRAAVANTEQAGLACGYWVEVARAPEIADEHPEWMASLQTHDEWRRFFPKARRPAADEVAKTYPWVPILSREPFNAQRERVESLLADLPAAKLIFLNDLQGAPSACGCGNPLCRWTSDYGKRRTTVPLGDEAAALFVTAIERAFPNAEVVPVWTTECEKHDGEVDGLCAGVGCFDGICWKAYTQQLMPLAATSQRLAVLTLFKEFHRDIPLYGRSEASWIEFAIKTFETMPPRHHGKSIPASRIVAIVQGWNVTAKEIAAQRTAVAKAGANGYVVAYDKIDQSWTPKIVRWK